MTRSILIALLVSASCFGAPANAPALPFSFVENRGQAAKEIRFTGEGIQFKAWFEQRAVTFQQGSAVVRMGFEGGRSDAEIQASQPLGSVANYIHGNDPGDQQTGIPMFGAIYYRNIWDGIDVRFAGHGSQLKTEYAVSPGVPLNRIRLRFDGRAEIDADGTLEIQSATGRYREEKPVLYQDTVGGRTTIGGAYRRNSDGTIGFRADPYDETKPLIVDPVILFSGYFGGASQTVITSIAVNSYYNVIVAGWTMSTNLPASGGLKSTYSGGVDAFVAGFSPSGGSLIFCTYLGGSADDRAFGVAVDSSNNTYITGQTSSLNFPLVLPFQRKLSGARDAFVAKLNPAGNALIFSTYLGGSGADWANGIALDSMSNPVVFGDTTSSNLPVTASAFQTTLTSAQNTFLAKLSSNGQSLLFMTYFGGNGTDHGAAVKLDPTDAIYVGGSTFSSTLPVLNAFQAHNAGGQDGFFAKFSSNGQSLAYASYYGGSSGSSGAPEEVNAIAVVVPGSFFVAGTTSSPDFPVTSGAIQPTFGGGSTDGFVGRINYLTGGLQKSTFVGGSSDDGINAMAVDFYREVYVAGYTSSGDFPTQNALQSTNKGSLDAFVLKTNFSQIIYSTYLGGNGSDSATAIAVDSLTSIVVAGTTGSASFPVVGSGASWTGSALSSFVTKIAPHFSPAVFQQTTWLIDPWHDTGYNGPNLNLSVIQFGLAGDLPIAGDWTGNGVRKVGVFRNGTWYLDMNGNGVWDAGDKSVAFGQAGDIPVVGDWNGTGTIKLGLYRQGTFILDLSGHLSGVATGLSDATFSFGLSTDIPIVADWNNSGTTKVGVFRNGQWLIDYFGTHTYGGSMAYSFGQAGDKPVVGDWDGSGPQNKLGVFRSGLWLLDYSGVNYVVSGGQNELIFALGGAGYTPFIF